MGLQANDSAGIASALGLTHANFHKENLRPLASLGVTVLGVRRLDLCQRHRPPVREP